MIASVLRSPRAFAVLPVMLLAAAPSAQREQSAPATITVADYERARALESRYTSVPTGAAEQFSFLDGARLRYRKATANGGSEWVIVEIGNADAPSKRAARTDEIPPPGFGATGGVGPPVLREIPSPD